MQIDDMKLIASIDYSDGNYVFDTRLVLLHSDGKFYTARDSGCSCPIPFEGFTIGNGIELLNFDELRNEVLSEGYVNNTATEVQEFLETIRRAIRETHIVPAGKIAGKSLPQNTYKNNKIGY